MTDGNLHCLGVDECIWSWWYIRLGSSGPHYRKRQGNIFYLFISLFICLLTFLFLSAILSPTQLGLRSRKVFSRTGLTINISPSDWPSMILLFLLIILFLLLLCLKTSIYLPGDHPYTQDQDGLNNQPNQITIRSNPNRSKPSHSQQFQTANYSYFLVSPPPSPNSWIKFFLLSVHISYTHFSSPSFLVKKSWYFQIKDGPVIAPGRSRYGRYGRICSALGFPCCWYRGAGLYLIPGSTEDAQARESR